MDSSWMHKTEKYLLKKKNDKWKSPPVGGGRSIIHLDKNQRYYQQQGDQEKKKQVNDFTYRKFNDHFDLSWSIIEEMSNW